MTNIQRRSLFAAIVVAIGLAGGAAITARQLVLSQCGTGPGQLNCFDPFAAGEMWRALEPVGERTTPNLLPNGEPDPAFAEDTGDVDSFFSPIWVSLAEDLTTALSEISNGECTFSHLGDPLESTRVCKSSTGAQVPPPLGQLFYPAGVAVFKDRVYVSDRMNHRVQVLDFFGEPLPITRPMGNGEPGIGNYTRAYQNPFGTGNLTGNRLSAPNGLAVDSLGRVLVADGGNGRVIIFNGTTGSPAFTNESQSRVLIPAGVSNEDEVVPTAVAISPNTAAVRPGTAPANPDARIVVLDRYRCSMNVYDAGFNFLWRYPQVKPALSEEPDSSCVGAEVSNAPGLFSLMAGAAIDAQGRIYVVDAYNNRVQVFTRGADSVPGTLIGTFGSPALAPGQPAPVEALETPSSILIDHNGRVVVNDSDNLRIAFFDVTFGVSPDPPITAAFLFEVPAPGDDIEGFPTALAEQHGTIEEGLDPAGRYLKVDTAGQRLQRLELADLAIVQASAFGGEGFFNVAVPGEKIDTVGLVKANVALSVDGTFPGVQITSVEALPPAASNTIGNDISPGAWVKYRFTYLDPNELPEITFTITAVGNKETLQDTEAPPVDVLVRGECDTCDAGVAVYVTPAPVPASPTPAIETTTDTGDWFRERVFARLTPIEATVGEVTHIEFKVTGSDLVYYGHGVKRTLLPVGARWVDVPIVGKDSTITYWAVTADNTVGPEHERRIQVDLDAPIVTFSDFTPAVFHDPLDLVDGPGGTSWWNGNVTATSIIVDDYSGTANAGGLITIGGEGRNLTLPVVATDYVNHTITVPSNNVAVGGQIVNIDRTAPVLVAPADLMLIADTSGIAQVPANFMATATDALSGLQGIVTRTGPATVTAGQTATFTFTATDRVGHTSTTTATVTAGSSALIYTGRVSVEYGRELLVSAMLLPSDATGSIRFTLVDPVRGNREVTAPLIAGVASTTIPVIVNHVGSHNLRVEYVGSDVEPTSTMVSIAVTPAPFGIDLNPKTKPYGAPDPALTYHPGGILFHPEDQVTGTLTRVPGEGIGSYAIQATMSISPDYTVTVHPAALTVLPREIHVSVGNLSRFYGDANPVWTAIVTGQLGIDPLNYTTQTTATTTTGVGTVPITITLGSNPNYQVSISPGTLTINPRPVIVTAENKVKLVGAVDPALTHTAPAPGSLLAGATFSGSLTRAPGEAVGDYAITKGTRTLGPNYDLTVVPGILTIVTNIPGNNPPVATADTASGTGAAPINIPVITNDSDPDGNALVVTAITQPAGGAAEGTVTTSGNVIVFTPALGFVGTTTFTYTISDGQGGTATATVTVTVTAGSTCTSGGYLTYSQGGWGNNGAPGQFLAAKFAQVYPSGSVVIGGIKTLTFTSSNAIKNFLPSGGTPAALTSSVVNPTGSQGGSFSGQLLALRLAVDFSAAGVTKAGLGQLVMVSGPLAGASVNDILGIANAVLGGQTSALPSGLSISALSSILDSLNMNYHEGTVNNGLLGCPGACVAGTINLNATSSASSGTAGNIRTFAGAAVLVKASAFSRVKTTGVWEAAFLGAFGTAGLGVTDAGEGDGSGDRHKLDNIGDRLNYILFEFSKPVVVTKAYLDYLGADSDATIWIGTKADPFANHITLSDAVLASLGTPQTSTASGSADRWAMFNGGAVSGNVLVIAADITDTTPEDAFKIAKLEVSCAAPANQPPTVTGANQSDDEGDAVSVAITAADPNDDDLEYRATGLPSGLTMNLNTGLVTGTLGYSTAGSYNVTVTVEDEAGLTATTTFVWTVANKNRAPDAVNDSLSTAKNTAKTMSVIANDSDPDSNTITVTAVTQPSKGSVVNNSNGTVKYTPPSNWTGTTSFTYTISDGNGGTDTATVSVTVGSHVDNDGCGDDHDHDGDHDRDDDRERDCDRDHRHNNDCDRDNDHDRDCDHDHSRNSRCNDNDGWYRDRDDDDDRDHDRNHNSNGVCSSSSHYGNWNR